MSKVYDPVERFLVRVRTATQSGSKDVRMTMDEASALAASIGIIVVENAKLRVNPFDVQQILGAMSADGGEF